MHISAQNHHADNVLNIALKSNQSEQPYNIIERSWKRCLNNYGLDPAANRGARIVTEQELNHHRESIEEFLRIAKCGLSQLYSRVSNLEYVVLLTDQYGVTVDYMGHDSRDKELKQAGLYLGADWSEEHAGTCGVGVCLAEMQALTCHQAEHFDEANISLTCTSAPILDPDGRPLAILDASALRSPREKNSQYLLLQLVTMHARMIESANFLYHFKNYWIIRFGEDNRFVDVNAENMIAFDNDGIIVGANQSARRIFAQKYSSLDLGNSSIGNSIDNIFNCSVDELVKTGRESANIARPIRLLSTDQLYYASIKCPSTRIIHASRPDTGSRHAGIDTSHLKRLSFNDHTMQGIIKRASRLVDSSINILITGETGTGKEIMAKALHNSSSRRDKPFIAVNCAAIPESLIESELFGYKPGTFTGAKSKGMRGLIVQSSGGTLFLDEIGDMPLHLQCRLLRVLSENEVLPLGSEKPVPVDLHVVSATHRDLMEMVAANEFREDLYYRLNGTSLQLPSLRERSDLKYIIDIIIQDESSYSDMACEISDSAMSALVAYKWPGNIRELRNAIRYALALCDTDKLEIEHLPDDIRYYNSNSLAVNTQISNDNSFASSHVSSQELPSEARVLAEKLKQRKWNITNVARDLNICRATVYRKMKSYGIVPPNEM